MRLFLILLAIFASVSLADPALKTSISEKAFQKISDRFLPLIFSKLSAIRIPDINQTIPTKLGTVHIELTNVTLSLKQPSLAIDVVQDKGLSWDLTKLFSVVDMNFNFQLVKLFNGKGTAHVTTESGRMTLLIGLTSQAGKPALQVLKNELDFGKFKIEIHGSGTIPAWVEQLIIEILGNLLKGVLERTVEGQIKAALMALSDKYLSQLPTAIPLGSKLQLNAALACDPIFRDEFAVLPFVGAVQQKAHPEIIPPFLPASLPDSLGGEMLELLYSDFIVNSALWQEIELGLLDFVIRDSDIPKWFPLRLNTHSWRLILPQLNKVFPSMEMIVRSNTSANPRTRIDPVRGMTSEHVIELSFNVLQPTPSFIAGAAPTEVTAFVLRVTFSVDIKVYVEGVGTSLRIAAKLGYNKCTLNVIESRIGKFELWFLQDTMDALLEHIVLPLFNKYAEKGIPIPSSVEGLKLVSPTVVYGDGFLVIETDFEFSV